MRILLVILGSTLIAGCTTAFSSNSLTKPSEHHADAVGIAYSLPRAVIGMRVLAVASNAQIVACVREAIAVADPGQQYFMQFQNSPFSADQFIVKRNEQLGTLQEIDIKAQDQFDQFVINLGASAGAISGLRFQNALANICTSPPNDAYELGDVEFDPTDQDDYEANVFGINLAATLFVRERLRECRGKTTQACREYERLNRMQDYCLKDGRPEQLDRNNEATCAPANARPIKVNTAKPAAKPHREILPTAKPIVKMKWVLPNIPKTVARARCDVGFCYRHTLPHTLHLVVGNSSIYSHTFQIPNSSPTVSLDLSRAIAVTKTTKITFGRLGEITQIDVKKGRGDAATGLVVDGAEAVELALLPQAVINAYFTSLKGTTDIISSMFTSETTAINNRKQLIEAEVALSNAKRNASGPRPTPQSSLANSKGFVLAASNAVPRARPAPTLTDGGEGQDPPAQEPQPQPQNPIPANGDTPATPGPGGSIPKKD
jgi:hypothetical protein